MLSNAQCKIVHVSGTVKVTPTSIKCLQCNAVRHWKGTSQGIMRFSREMAVTFELMVLYELCSHAFGTPVKAYSGVMRVRLQPVYFMFVRAGVVI